MIVLGAMRRGGEWMVGRFLGGCFCGVMMSCSLFFVVLLVRGRERVQNGAQHLCRSESKRRKQCNIFKPKKHLNKTQFLGNIFPVFVGKFLPFYLATLLSSGFAGEMGA